MNTHTYSIALPALPEEFAYARNPATGCVEFRAPKETEWFLSVYSTTPIYTSRDRAAGQNCLILVKAPEGYRFMRDKQGKPLFQYPKDLEHYVCADTGNHYRKEGYGLENVPCYILEKLPEPIPAPPEGFEWVLDEKGERIRRQPIPGDYVARWDSHQSPILFTGPYKNGPCYILKKIKPSYTEAVKAAGFKKWPLHHDWKWMVINNNGCLFAFFGTNKPKLLQHLQGWDFARTSGIATISTLLPEPMLPPRLADDYEWHETLLCIDDFEV